jgi:hypothetical protein
MAYISVDHPVSSPIAAIRARLGAAWEAYSAHRRKRAIYLRTLRELQSYRPHELHDLRLQGADFEELARQHAGL